MRLIIDLDIETSLEEMNQIIKCINIHKEFINSLTFEKSVNEESESDYCNKKKRGVK